MALALSMVRGKTGLFFLSVFQQDGVTPQNLAGSQLWFHAAFSDYSLVIDKFSPSGGIIVTNAAAGLATLTLDPADTTGLPINGDYVMRCELIDVAPSAAVYLLNRGTLTVSTNVGTP